MVELVQDVNYNVPVVVVCVVTCNKRPQQCIQI